MYGLKWRLLQLRENISNFKLGGKQIDTYRFDLKEVINGSLEIDSEHGVEAEQKFMGMSLRDLLQHSYHASNRTERAIRFVTAR